MSHPTRNGTQTQLAPSSFLAKEHAARPRMQDYRTTLWNFEIKRLAGRILAVLLVVRLCYLVPFLAQFDLAADECYYWDWGRRLAWGYYSKPPMIGWLMGAVARLKSNSLMGIRICALLMATCSLWMLHQLAFRLESSDALGSSAAEPWVVPVLHRLRPRAHPPEAPQARARARGAGDAPEGRPREP